LGVLVATPAVEVITNVMVFWQATPFIYQTFDAVPARAITIVPGNTVTNGVPEGPLAQRLNAALTLYRMGKTQIILVSGNRQEKNGYDEVTAMHRWLVQRGVSDAAIVDDPAGFRTLDTMERAARIFKVKSAIVCSQGVHPPRSVFLARHAGIDAVGLVTNPGQVSHVLSTPHETLGSAVAFVETSVGRGPEVLGPAQPIGSDTRTTASLR